VPWSGDPVELDVRDPAGHVHQIGLTLTQDLIRERAVAAPDELRLGTIHACILPLSEQARKREYWLMTMLVKRSAPWMAGATDAEVTMAIVRERRPKWRSG